MNHLLLEPPLSFPSPPEPYSVSNTAHRFKSFSAWYFNSSPRSTKCYPPGLVSTEEYLHLEELLVGTDKELRREKGLNTLASVLLVWITVTKVPLGKESLDTSC